MSKLNLFIRFGGAVDVTNVANGETLQIVAQPSESGNGVMLAFIEPNTVNYEHKFQIDRPERRKPEASAVIAASLDATESAFAEPIERG
ncbi:hypothetical protein [Singulisphaera sp. PoT]|uniref:hypothetical protein n=1 Tax=Singulisphaera sp. PoT TaxID=3411797 RepID=UPI003BF6075C